MLFFYLILSAFASNSLLPLDRILNPLMHQAGSSNSTSKTNNFLQQIQADPAQFIAEAQNLDPVAIKNIISLLEALKAESEQTENNLITALNNANTALGDANTAVADAGDVVSDAEQAVADAIQGVTDAQGVKATKDQELVDANSVLTAKKAAHQERKTEKNTAQKQHDDALPGLNNEQRVLSEVIAMLADIGGWVPTTTGLHKYGGTDTYFEMVNGVAWALVMKLSRNEFCSDSGKWTDGQAYHADFMLTPERPNNLQYDAKSLAFHKLEGVKELKFDTQRGSSVTVKFVSGATPENLMTTNDVKFAEYPDWATWKATFGSDRNLAPMFVRAGQVVTDPAPICRNANLRIMGCGTPCMFCMMAGDGSGCPAAGNHNDISSGVGNNRAGCGGGDASRCSSGGHWSGSNQVRVWARVD